MEFGARLRLTYVMYGRARELDRPLAEARAWLDAAESGMPVDPRLWHDDPPASSYPACLAVKAATEQGLEGPYLRLLREGFACERRRLDNADALVALAGAVPGLDVARFRIDLQSHAIVEAFGADLERARGDGGARPVPRLEVHAEGTEPQTVAVTAGDQDWAAHAVAAGAAPAGEARLGVPDALRRFGRLATPEVAAACGLPGPRAPAELWRLACEWQVACHRRLSGELWALA